MRHTVCRLADLADLQGRVVEVAGEEIAVFRVGGQIHAIANTCPHRGAALAFGELRGTTVTCPLHAWPFDVRTGRCLEFPEVAVPTYRVRVEGDEVQIEL